MQFSKLFLAFIGATIVSAASVSSAQEHPAADSSAQTAVIPSIRHAPVSVVQANSPLIATAVFENAQTIARVLLLYRIPGNAAILEVPFLRSSKGPYQATISAEQIRAPKLEYAIEIEDVNGKRHRGFASRDAMHLVQIREDLAELSERAFEKRLDYRRSVVNVSGEYVAFGETSARVIHAPGDTPQLESVRDEYYRIEAGYTYRPLGMVAEFGLRAGIVRGTAVVPNEMLRDKYDVGLNYGAPTVRFRLDENWHVEGELLTSMTEVGFSTGAGAALIVGDPYGTKLTLGFETIQTFGTRMYSRMDLCAGRQWKIAPIIEVTDMPHADRFGVRLQTEARYDLGNGFEIGARVGYQARVFWSGGISAGTTLSYAF